MTVMSTIKQQMAQLIEQLRQARITLGWTEAQLAERSGISRDTIAKIEAGRRRAQLATVRAVRQALEAGGIEFDADGINVHRRGS
jgi:transcriptional regulator with XRE-family HTH domain